MVFGPPKDKTFTIDEYAMQFVSLQMLHLIWMQYHPIWTKLRDDKECRRELVNRLEDNLFLIFEE
jgi:hypothetical protein